MKIILFVGLTLAAIRCDATPTCGKEITAFAVEHITCVHTSLKVQGLVEKIAKGSMTYVTLKQNIASLCEEANSAVCNQELETPIEGICSQSETFQHLRNSLKVTLTFNEYLCQNNGTKYLELVQNGGAKCYFNKEKTKCFKRNIRLANGGHNEENGLKDSTICRELEADISCLHHYDTCANENVKLFSSEIFNLIKEKMSC